MIVGGAIKSGYAILLAGITDDGNDAGQFSKIDRYKKSRQVTGLVTDWFRILE